MPKISKVAILVERFTGDGRAIIQGIARYADTHRLWVFYRPVSYSRDPREDKLLLPRLKKWGVEGIFFRGREHLDDVIKISVPTVICSNILPGMTAIKNLPNIVTDDLLTGKMAAEYFLEKGFTNFAYCGLKDIPASAVRGEGFSQRISKAGYQINIYAPASGRTNLVREAEEPYLINWLKSLTYPVALFCCNDERGLEVIESCKYSNINVPEDIAVLGVGNDELSCELSNPPLSSIARSNQRAGYEAAELLDRLLAGEKMTNQTIIMYPLYVITRQSTDVLAIEDSDVKTALKYINNHWQNIIRVEDVIEQVPLTKRTLQMKFDKILRTTIFDELMRIRFNHICQMLAETNLSITQIAYKVGYSDINHISRSFKKQKGMTPLEYRRRFGLKQ